MFDDLDRDFSSASGGDLGGGDLGGGDLGGSSNFSGGDLGGDLGGSSNFSGGDLGGGDLGGGSYDLGGGDLGGGDLGGGSFEKPTSSRRRTTSTPARRNHIEDPFVNKVVRLLLTFFLGFIGSFVINHSPLKPEGFKSRTCAYFFLTMITFGIYGLVASLCNLTFDPNKSSNIGYFKD